MRKLIANKKKRKMAMSWEKISEGEEEGEKSRVERLMQGKRIHKGEENGKRREEREAGEENVKKARKKGTKGKGGYGCRFRGREG